MEREENVTTNRGNINIEREIKQNGIKEYAQQSGKC